MNRKFAIIYNPKDATRAPKSLYKLTIFKENNNAWFDIDVLYKSDFINL